LKRSNGDDSPHLPPLGEALSPINEERYDLTTGEECSRILLQHVVADLHDMKGSLATIHCVLTTFLQRLAHTEGDRRRLDLALQQVACITGTLENLFFSIKHGYCLDGKILEDIHVILERCLHRIQSLADTHRIMLTREYYPAPLLVLVNPVQIEQSLTNVCYNAIEAMQEHGSLVVATDLVVDGHATWVVIRVSDTGVGISPTAVHDVFAPYYTTKQKGTGLGLWITQKVIGDHRGTVEIASIHGRGTSILIRLPLQKGEKRKSCQRKF
jgi:signal transduction histidine kinase